MGRDISQPNREKIIKKDKTLTQSALLLPRAVHKNLWGPLGHPSPFTSSSPARTPLTHPPPPPNLLATMLLDMLTSPHPSQLMLPPLFILSPFSTRLFSLLRVLQHENTSYPMANLRSPFFMQANCHTHICDQIFTANCTSAKEEPLSLSAGEHCHLKLTRLICLML